MSARLAGLPSEHGVDVDLDVWAVCGRVPEAVVAPETAVEVAEVLRRASVDGVGVVPRGGGSFLGARKPRTPFVVLSTARLSGVRAYEPADLTLTAGAGTTLAQINAALGEHRQWCPFDPPGGPGRTLGGALASGHVGPRSAGYGAPRDHLLGATLVTGDGRVLELGGRVVKNVAGFDLIRVTVGSRGTVGVITSACIRVFPLPAARRALVMRAGSPSELMGAARAVATASVVPSGALLRADARSAGLAVLLEGPRGQIDAEQAVLERAAGASFERVDGASAHVLFDTGSDLVDRAPLVLTSSVLPSRIGDPVAAAAAHLGDGGALTADVLGGTVRVGLRPEGPEDDPLRSVEALRAAVERAGGTLVIDSARTSVDLSRSGSVPDPHVAELEARLRRAFDPAGVLWRSEERT